MNIGQEVSVVCTDNDKKVNGKIIRLYRGGLDVAIDNTIIKMQLKKNNVYVGSLHGLEFTLTDNHKRENK